MIERTSVPILVSLAGIGCSVLAIFLLAADGDAAVALRFALLAFLCDMIDGMLARRWKCETTQGRIMDSLGDVPTHLLFPTLYFVVGFGFTSLLSLAAMTVFVVAGMYRLSRFTAEGFVVTAQGPAYSGIPVFVTYLLLLVFVAIPPSENVFSALLLLMAFGMVSRVPIPKPTPTASFIFFFAGVLFLLRMLA